MNMLGVTVEDLVRVLKEKRTRIPYEIGAFVVLEACEAVQARPIRVEASLVRIGDDGRVSVDGDADNVRVPECSHSLAKLLAYVLVAAGPGVPPALLDLVESGPSDGGWDLGRFRDELEAALVPLNRGAARRVLSRMLREAAGEFRSRRNSVRPPPESDELDAELDGLLGGSSSPTTRPMPRVDAAPAASQSPVSAKPRASVGGSVDAKPPKILRTPRGVGQVSSAVAGGLDSLADVLEPEPPIPSGAGGSSPAGSPGFVQPVEDPPVGIRTPTAEPVQVNGGSVEEAPPDPDRPRRVRPSADLDELETFESAPRAGGGRGLVWAGLFLLLSVALVVGLIVFRPDVVDRAMGRETAEEREAREAESRALAEAAAEREAHRRRFGRLVVEVEPAEAQVLLFVGRGPATVPELPVGIAHEFIAVADERSPTRALVSATASWEETGEGPRYELAMQTGDEPMAFDDLRLGSSRLEHGELGTPSGQRGTVRVITNPPGARVYLLIGFSPSAEIRNVRTDEPLELLLWHEDHLPRRVPVMASDWRQEGDQPSARVQVRLEARR